MSFCFDAIPPHAPQLVRPPDHRVSGVVLEFSPIKPLKIAEQVAGSLRDAILKGALSPGETLPSERDLAGRFKVNRGSIREAIHKLEAWGLVDVRQGGATRVRDFLTSAGLQLLPYLLAPGGALDPKMLVDLLDLRVGLLGWVASRAARNGGVEAAKALREALEALKLAPDAAQRQALDYAFYEAMVQLTNNGVALLLNNAIKPVYVKNSVLFEALYQSSETHFQEAAVQAIEARDETAASEAMRAYGLSALKAMGL